MTRSSETAELFVDLPPLAGSFANTLLEHGLTLLRADTDILQVNVGLLCNQLCRHCHLDAGPGRTEVMDRKTMGEVIAYAGRAAFDTVDVTGGAPELVPDIGWFLEGLAEVAPKVILRSNLTAIADGGLNSLIGLCSRNKIRIIASFPSLSSSQTDAQRGQGVMGRSLGTLALLNAAGYGQEGTGLVLDLVSNPAGAFLPPGQEAAEKRFRAELAGKHGIAFNSLYVFANAPLGRFRDWLKSSGNYEAYLGKLAQNFNPCTIGGLMCGTLISVGYDGTLYDCDFNQAAGLPHGGTGKSVRDMEGPPARGAPIATGDHCYACTAGAGFT